MTDQFETAMQDLEKTFSSPEEIPSRSEFTQEEKISLLRQWETDVREKMVASEEGMTSTDSGKDAELLKSIHSTLEAIGAVERDVAPANKAGG